jgi:hypothetical protein
MKHWLAKKIYKLYQLGIPEPSSISQNVKSSKPYSNGEFKNPMHITLYNAIGGHIVKFTYYDDTKDRNKETTYIVGADENLKEAIAKFIAAESIKHAG